MKKKDAIFFIFLTLFFSLFYFIPSLLDFYKKINSEHGMILSFVKFAILATLGEIIGLRVSIGNYYKKGFGIIPRAIVWGFLGLLINSAFIIFSTGVPNLLKYLGFSNSDIVSTNDFSLYKLFVAFSISLFMNTIFAPIMMTIHKITDRHIEMGSGKILNFFKPIKFGEILKTINWDVMYYFVFKKTIPLFWIPAHTITFILPAEYRVLFAAILGILLGVILAFASQMRKN
ncbi:Mpv17/PMP22 family protein [bacterium]|nr:Mpv17/PMP22 family protein [bacterium]